MSVAEMSSGARPGGLSVEVGMAILAKSLEMQKQSVETLDKILENAEAGTPQLEPMNEATSIDILV